MKKLSGILALFAMLLLASPATADDAKRASSQTTSVNLTGQGGECGSAMLDSSRKLACQFQARTRLQNGEVRHARIAGYHDEGLERRKGMVAGAILGGAIGGSEGDWEGALLGAVIGGFLGSRKNAAPDQRELEAHYRRLEEARIRGLDNSYVPAADIGLYDGNIHWSAKPRKDK